VPGLSRWRWNGQAFIQGRKPASGEGPIAEVDAWPVTHIGTEPREHRCLAHRAAGQQVLEADVECCGGWNFVPWQIARRGRIKRNKF
jgi:hypothetical protein